jgi:hypothetical protein
MNDYYFFKTNEFPDNVSHNWKIIKEYFRWSKNDQIIIKDKLW